jgi:HAMP domain-containing protein
MHGLDVGESMERMRGFDEGSVVLLTLHSPRQKCVGVLLRMAPAGVELRGVALESLEDLARQVRAGEPAIASTAFFPMHRVERMELDEPAGELPSLAQSFAAQVGRTLEEVFCGSGDRER